MESLHIKIEPYEVTESRRQILYIEMNLLNVIKKLSNFRKLRNEELQKKSAIKTEINEIKKRLDNLKKILPSANFGSKKKQIEEIKKEKEKRMKIEEELEEIKKKIELLS